METCGAAPHSTPLTLLPPRSVSEGESDSDCASMCSEGKGDGTFSLVEGKSAKRKRKLVASPPPAAATHRVSSPGNSASHPTQSPSQSVSKPKIPPIVIPDNRNYREILFLRPNSRPGAKAPCFELRPLQSRTSDRYNSCLLYTSRCV